MSFRLSDKRERVWINWADHQNRGYRVKRDVNYRRFHCPCYECGKHVYKYAERFPQHPTDRFVNIYGHRYWERGHVYPKWAGGTQEASNLRIVCKECNQGVDKELTSFHRAFRSGYHHSLAVREAIVPLRNERHYWNYLNSI